MILFEQSKGPQGMKPILNLGYPNLALVKLTQPWLT